MAAVSPALKDDIRHSAPRADYTPTPDRRYFVVRGRLWRLSNPRLAPEFCWGTHDREARRPRCHRPPGANCSAPQS
jgi:hypothetical protein